jgi:hypothetical protein
MSSELLRRLGIALAALLVLLGLFALVRMLGSDRQVALDLPRIDTAAVDTVSIRGADSDIVLTRGERGNWFVNGFPASPDAVRSLLTGLADTAASSELVAESETSHERLKVDSASGRRLRVVSRDRTLLELVAGERVSGMGGGIVVRRPDASSVYSLRGSLAEAVDRGVDEWKDKRIAVVEPDSLGTVEVRRGARGYTLIRADSIWKFSGGAAADSSAVAGLLSSLREIRASAFASQAESDSTSFARNRGRLRLLSRSGAQLANLVFDSTSSGVWVRNDSGGVVYRIDSWTWNQIAPAESTLRVRRGG